MQQFASIDPSTATGRTKTTFDGFQKALGTIPNMIKVLANAPAALNAYVSFDAALSAGKLPHAVREQLAISVASANSCDYCLSAHNVLGSLAGLDAPALKLAQGAEAADVKTSALLLFAHSVVSSRGRLMPSELEKVRSAGWSDEEIIETIAVVAVNIFTNYFNNIAGTDIDFPVVKSAAA